MSAPRGEFSSKFGFLMAAAGSAVGLGNIWAFPTQVASNGGAAFLVVYLVMALCIAYPALMAEFIIGRHTRSNPVNALRSISGSALSRGIGITTGFAGILTACLILGFYGIAAGWMASNALSAVAELFGMTSAAAWLESQSVGRSLVFTAVFMTFTVAIICGGVKGGIEKWCSRLMPTLVVILFGLIVYVFTLDGAMQGLRAYLVPDLSHLDNPRLYVSAMGQAFFSLSLGVGTMLIYGSYVSDREDIVSLGRSVTLLDVGMAVFAGLLIIPAMYVALNQGVQIYDANGALIQEDGLIFTVLPSLFDSMGAAGTAAGLAVFVLLSLAALTSTVSILEVPVAYAVENHDMARKRATILIGVAIFALSTIIILNFEALFGLVIVLATQWGEPLVGLFMCLFAGWVMSRNSILNEIRKGNEGGETGWFWKIWPNYVRFIVPAAILTIFLQRILA